MLSVYPQMSVSTKDTCQQQGQMNELEDFQRAIDSFTKLIMCSGTSAIRLHCAVPTWSCSTETCVDLHDLHELRSRFLIFIHNLIQSLRSSGISASYSLAPSSSSRCLICALPPKADINQTKLVDDLQGSPKFNIPLKSLPPLDSYFLEKGNKLYSYIWKIVPVLLSHRVLQEKMKFKANAHVIRTN
ncbi:hypothetical protein BYT27DRAFT_7241962 [Phlegmacium glaucopus]|nr:hypothetical protein BYT27DRAFT_7241962 [Phlegmacium glaucopus]